jgi:hypothetical protein
MARKYQLHGAFPSKAGDSAYQVAQKNGFEGTEQEWLASLVGPQGPHGTGDSAYQVAQKNGFEGTEQEWLDSLVGPPGPQGPEGATGATFHITLTLEEDVSNVVLKLPVKWEKIVQFNLNGIPKMSGESNVEMYTGGLNYKKLGTYSTNTEVFNIYGVYYVFDNDCVFTFGYADSDRAVDIARPSLTQSHFRANPDYEEILIFTKTEGVVFQAGTKFDMWGVYAQ